MVSACRRPVKRGELSGRQRQDARARAGEMYRVPQAGPWWPAVGAPLERGVGSTGLSLDGQAFHRNQPGRTGVRETGSTSANVWNECGSAWTMRPTFELARAEAAGHSTSAGPRGYAAAPVRRALDRQNWPTLKS